MVTPPPKPLFIDTSSDRLRTAYASALRTEKSVVLSESIETALCTVSPKEISIPVKLEGALTAWLEGHSLHGYRDVKGNITAAIRVHDTAPCTLAELFAPLPAAVAQQLVDLCDQHALFGPWHLKSATKDSILPNRLFSYPDINLMPIFAGIGLNWAAYSAFEALGHSVSALEQPLEGIVSFSKDGSIHLTASDIYLDLDDTLLVHGKPYEGALTLMQRAHEKGTALHLITRHYRDPVITLKEHGLAENEFSSVIWIKDDIPKSQFIKGRNPIFVDDAFRERKEVFQALNVLSLPAEAAGLIKLAFSTGDH